MIVAEVDWEDTARRNAWIGVDEVEHVETVSCKSVGYLMVDDGKKIVLTQSLVENNAMTADVLAIPARSIIAIRKWDNEGKT